MRNFVTLLVLSINLVFSNLVFALPSDDNQPLIIHSDQLEYQRQKGVITHTGHVVVDQGTRHLTADRLILFQNKSKKIDKILAQGIPAHYQEKTDANKGVFSAEANNIEYLQSQRMLYLTENAKLSQDGDALTGPKLEYNLNSKVVKTPKSAHGKTKIVLQPGHKNLLPVN